MAEVRLQTARLVLRDWCEADVAHWLAHLDTPAVKQYLGGTQGPEKVRERIALMHGDWQRQGYAFLAVERREDGAFLGACGLATIPGPAAPEPLASGYQVGWQLRVDAWGHGYATEAAGAMLDHAFATLGWPTVYGQTSERNVPSWKVMQRLGMERRAELDYVDESYPPEDNPTMVWSLAREAWETRT